MKHTRVDPSLLKFGFVAAALVLLGLGLHTASLPGGNKEIQVTALAFAGYQAVAELIVLPLLNRALTRKRPYNPADMLIHLAFHQNGVILSFILTFISHEPRYLYYLGLPCLVLMLLTPTGKR